MRRLRALRLFVFVILGLGAVLFADLGQAIGETFAVPQENRMHGLVNQTRNDQGLGTPRDPEPHRGPVGTDADDGASRLPRARHRPARQVLRKGRLLGIGPGWTRGHSLASSSGSISSPQCRGAFPVEATSRRSRVPQTPQE